MKLTGKPNHVVQKRVFSQGRFKIVPWFKFDENGMVELDDSKLSKLDQDKLKKKFHSELKEYTEEELREMAKEKGIKSWHVKSVDKLKQELGV